MLKKFFTFLCIIFCSVLALSAKDIKKELRGGWYLWDPYQYLDQGKGAPKLTGLDISLQMAIARETKYKITFDPISWKDHLKGLALGTRDIAAGATRTPEREVYAYFSDPYREESNSIFILKNSKQKLSFKTIKEFIQEVKRHSFKLGVVAGFVYVDPQLNTFVADPDNAHLFVQVENTYECLDLLLDGKVDGFLADRIAGATASWRTNNLEQVEEQVLGTIPICLMFSKKTMSQAVVADFNRAIQEVKKSGQYDAIMREYLFPVLLMQTIDRNWFIIIDIIGTVAFAISGLIIAYRERASFFKAALLATLPAVGGGIIRDLIVGRSPIGVLQTPIYIIAICITILVVYILVRWGQSALLILRRRSQKNFLKISQHSKSLALLIEAFDALGLSAFTIIGVTIAFSTKSDPLWLWGPIFAVITGIGGGIMRDLLRDDKIIWALRGEFYAEIPLIWGALLTSYLIVDKKFASPEIVLEAVIITLIGGFLTRMIVLWFHIKPPKFRAYEDENPSLSLEKNKTLKDKT